MKVGGCAATVIAGKLAIALFSRAGMITESELKLAFDQRKYTGLSREKFLSRYTQDLAALSQEASTLRLINYTPVNFVKLDDHTMVCPEYDSKADISAYNSWDGFFEAQCSLASEAVRDILLHTEHDGLVIWISPSADPRQPFLSRLNLYLKHRDDTDREVVENYSITWHQSADYCLGLVNLIRILSDRPDSYPFENISDLRQTALFISLDLRPRDNFWQQASELFPLPENIWQEIISGRARENFDWAKDIAKKRAAEAYEELKHLDPYATSAAYITTGAKSEKYMADSGYPIGNMSDCDNTNTSVLASRGTATTIPFYGTSSSETSCPEIKCSRCSWKPNSAQLADIASRHLACCPDCGWIPGTPVYTRSQPKIIFAVNQTPAPEIKLSIQTFTPQSPVHEDSSLSWVDYYFLPWLLDACYNQQQ